MKFTNSIVRIGPTGAQKELFFMPGRGGKLRKGKRSELPEYFSNLGLNAYEFPAGRMAKFNDSPEYVKFRANAQKYNIAISIHAPYYISLTSVNPEIYQSSIRRVANVYAWAVWLNAKRIVIHPGSYGKKSDRSSSILMTQITEGISEGMEMAEDLFPNLKSQFHDICLCPETMGKHGQLGTVDEVITICKDLGVNRVRPCIDFGHVYARNLGKLKGRRLYESVFEQLEQELGSNITQHLHIHYSKIEFTQKGEKKHHPNTSTWGPEIDPLFEFIQEQNLTPIIINESPELEPDAVLLMNQWKHLQKAT